MKDTTFVLIILTLIPLTIIGAIVLYYFQKPVDFDKWCMQNIGNVTYLENVDCSVGHASCWKLCDFNGSIVNFYDEWRVPNASSRD